MKNERDLPLQEKKFRSFLNKTIIGASKTYFAYNYTRNEIELEIFENSNILSYEDLTLEQDISYMCLENLFTDYMLYNATKSLSFREKLVIFLIVIEEKSGKEVAEKMNMNIDSVYRIKKRALTKIRKYIRKDDM